MVVSYICTIVVSLFVTIYNKKSIPGMIPSILLFTLFVVTWFPINIVSLIKKDVKWDHIGHNRNMNIDEVID